MTLFDELKKLPFFMEVEAGEYKRGLLNVLNGCYVQEHTKSVVVEKGKGILGSLNDQIELEGTGKLILNWVKNHNGVYSQKFVLSEEQSINFVELMKKQ